MIHDYHDNWHVEIHHSRWTRFKRWCKHNNNAVVVITGTLLLIAMLIVGPPVCGAFH